MHHRLKHTAAGTLAASALLALAASPAAATPATVGDQLARADAALARAAQLANRGSDAVAVAQLNRADRLTAAADRRSDRTRGSERARDERAVAAQYQQNAEAAARLVRSVDGAADATAADAVADAVEGRERALDTLTRLAGRLPAPAQQGLARAVVSVTAAGPRPGRTLDAALSSGDVDENAVDDVEQAIDRVHEGVRADGERLAVLAERLPAAARRGIERARTRNQAAQEQAAARSGSADACAAEREADPAAFETRYRTNPGDDESNAYGMCVSGHSAEQPPGPPAQQDADTSPRGQEQVEAAPPADRPAESTAPAPAGPPAEVPAGRPAQ